MFRRVMSPKGVMETLAARGPGVQPLDFMVRPARSAAELAEVAHLRHQSYGKHIELGASERPEPDSFDYLPNAVVLIAIDQATLATIGTMRVVLGVGGARLQLDDYVPLDRARLGVPAEAARLALLPARGRARERSMLIKLALWKAYYQLCERHGIDTMVVAARALLWDEYKWLDFHEVTRASGSSEPLSFVPGGVFNQEHRVLAQPVAGLPERWLAMNHQFYPILFGQQHPDIRPFVEGGVNPLSRLAGDAGVAAPARAPIESRPVLAQPPRMSAPGLAGAAAAA